MAATIGMSSSDLVFVFRYAGAISCGSPGRAYELANKNADVQRGIWEGDASFCGDYARLNKVIDHHVGATTFCSSCDSSPFPSLAPPTLLSIVAIAFPLRCLYIWPVLKVLEVGTP